MSMSDDVSKQPTPDVASSATSLPREPRPNPRNFLVLDSEKCPTIKCQREKPFAISILLCSVPPREAAPPDRCMQPLQFLPKGPPFGPTSARFSSSSHVIRKRWSPLRPIISLFHLVCVEKAFKLASVFFSRAGAIEEKGGDTYFDYSTSTKTTFAPVASTVADLVPNSSQAAASI